MLTSKTICQKSYEDLQSLLVLIHYLKDILMGFEKRLPLSTDWKGKNYNSILIIVNYLTKMVYYKQVKVTINTLRLVEVIINMVV